MGQQCDIREQRKNCVKQPDVFMFDASQFDESDQHPGGGGLLLDLDQLITELLSVNGINSCILQKLPADSHHVRPGSVVHREEPLPRPNDSQGVVVRGYASTDRH